MKIADDNCNLCPALANCRTQVVHGGGYVGGIMVVGSGPHQWDDADNVPFTGKEGTLLRHIAQAAGIPENKIYRAQATKCKAPGDRAPKKSEIDACHPHLIAEIKAVKPKVILALGSEALQSLYGGLNTDDYDERLVEWEADVCYDQNIWKDDVLKWQGLTKEERKGLYPDGKPKKPKAPPKPKRPPAAKNVAIRDVAGHSLIQPETGIPIVATYSPRYIMRKRWHLVNIVVSHFKKAQRLWLGKQVVGQLGEYAVIDSIEQLEALRDYLLSDDVETIWFDCETTGLKWMDDEVLCWQFAGCEGEGYTVPLLWNPGDGDTTNPENGNVDLHPCWDGDFPKMIDIMREIFESDKPKGGHNVIFDMRMLMRDSKKDFVEAVTGFAIKVNGRIIDTELTHVSVAESLPHNMTSVLANETDMPYYEADVRDHKKNMAKAPNGPVWEYGAADADGLPRMFKPLRERAEAEGVDWVLDKVTTPLLDVCRDIEERGFLVDMEHFQKLCLFYHDQKAIVEQQLWEAVPHRDEGWKYGYSPELQTVLFKELGLPKSGRLTKAAKECDVCPTGNCDKHDQTGKDALADIYRIQPHPVIPILLRLKKITKMITTYLDGTNGNGGFTKYFRKDGRIHTTAKVARAETGRLATEAPNAQNMVNYLHIHPKVGGHCSDAKCDQYFPETYGIDSENAYHDIVIAKPGYGILNCDWSQAEVWGLAYRLITYTGDRTLLDVLESGVDIHLWMARKMYPDVAPEMDDMEWKNTYSHLRRKAKTAIFGIGYGLTAQGFALREGCSEEEAQETIDRYMAVVPGLPRLFAIVRAQLLKHGYIENEFKRRRHIDILHLLQAMRERGEFEGLVREGINFPIQSSCSDLHSMASYATFKSPVIAARDCGIILTVHDSLTFEFWYPDEDTAVKTAHLIKDLWEKIAWNTIKPDGTPLHWKIPVECEWGLTWGTPLWKLDAKGTLKKLTKDVISEEDKPVVYEEEVDPVTDKVISFEPVNIDRVA